MKIHEDHASELGWECSSEDYEFVAKQFVDQGRWTTDYLIVFRSEGQLYGFYFSEGSTEYQDGTEPFFPDSDGNVECFPVVGKEVIEYVKSV